MPRFARHDDRVCNCELSKDKGWRGAFSVFTTLCIQDSGWCNMPNIGKYSADFQGFRVSIWVLALDFACHKRRVLQGRRR